MIGLKSRNAVKNFHLLVSKRGASVSQNKKPRRFPAGAVIPQATRMSGIEIAMDAKAERPVVHVKTCVAPPMAVRPCVVLLPGRLALNRLAYITSTPQIVVLGDVPLGARAEPPGAPVVVAAGGCNSLY